MKNLTRLIAEYVEATRYDDLPPEVVKACSFLLADTLSVGLAGYGAPGIPEIRAVTLAEKGVGQATVWGYGDLVPATQAALINGAMAHSWDFDANHDLIGYKACVTVVPAAVATAQLLNGQGVTVTGKNFLTAVHLGMEIGSRIGLGINPKPCHAVARAVGCFGSAVSASKLLGLSVDKIGHALGVAYAETGFGTKTIQAPALTKRLGAGIASRAGVWAALLADKGFTGPNEVFSGSRGFYQIYFGEPEDRDLILRDLGVHYETTTNISVKPYPSCRATHSPIDCALTIKEREKISAEEIDKVVVRVAKTEFEAYGGGGNPERLKALREPCGIVDAQFSIPYTVAVALVNGTVRLGDFTADAFKRERVLEMARKIELALDTQQENRPDDMKMLGRVVMEVKTKKGQRFEASIDTPKSVNNKERLFEKAYDCLEYSGLFNRKEFDKILDTWLHLAEVDNVNEVFKTLSPRKEKDDV